MTHIGRVTQLRSKSARLQAVAPAANAADIFGDTLLSGIKEIAKNQVIEMLPEILDHLQAQGWRPPTPSEAFVPESAVREVLGRRKGSPMAHVTFRQQWLDPGKLIRVPASVTGNSKQQFIYMRTIEKTFPEPIVEKLRPHIQQPEYFRKHTNTI